jgi:hypothetical protein
LTDYFSQEAIENFAKETGFVIRDSKLTGFMFLDILLFNLQTQKEQSLEDLALLLLERYGITITKQAIDDRFNEKAVEFFKKLLGKAISEICNSSTQLLCSTKFKRIRVKDSTSFQLPKNMEKYYPGSGGSGSKACIRIQFEYDLVSGEVIDLSLHAYNDQDLKNAYDTKDNIESEDLIIRDLGYVRSDVLTEIINKQAKYLNRLHANSDIYELKNGELKKISFAVIVRYLRLYKLQYLEKEVYIGIKNPFKTRLVIELMLEEKVNERIRKAEKEAKKKGRKLSVEFKTRAWLNLFITNVDIEELPVEDIRQIYSLRWQIEIVFKTWKSILKIHVIKKMKVLRFECQLYAKLIWVVINLNIVWEIIKHFYQKKIGLSYLKIFKAISERKEKIRQAILAGKEKIKEYLMLIFPDAVNYFGSDKKKGKLSFYEKMLLLSEAK